MGKFAIPLLNSLCIYFSEEMHIRSQKKSGEISKKKSTFGKLSEGKPSKYIFYDYDYTIHSYVLSCKDFTI